jgi:hypothetical protein
LVLGKKLARVFFLAALRVMLPLAAAAQSQAPPCSSVAGAGVVRFDDAGKRLFVSAQLKEIATARKARSFFQPLQQTVEKCRPSWGKDWSVSVFSEATYAGYKDEPQLQEFVKDGRWSRAYVGEYDRTSQKLTLNPQDPKKMKSLQVVLP